jgi:hypothetical protein
MIDWVNYIIVFVGGGLTAYVLMLLIRTKAVFIHSRRLKIDHYVQGHLFICTGFLLDLQFVNFSYRPVLINKCRTRFYDGEKYITLSFKGYTLSPADIIDRNASRVMKFTLLSPYIHVELPLEQLHGGKVFLEFTYYVQNVRRTFLIPANEFVLDEAGKNEKHFFPN